jgi:hypothetical protein
MGRQFAVRLALIAFAASTMRSLIDAVDFGGALQIALLHGAVFFGLGWVCGELARRVVEENARQEAERRIKDLEQPASQAA